MVFANREDAARRLARKLAGHRGQNPLVLAIPRGAVPMGRIVADELEGELDVVLVHKIGAPGNPEFAVGAVAETGEVVAGPWAAEYGIPQTYIESEGRRQLGVLRERRGRYTPGRPSADPAGRVVIVLDDGVATGSTMLAALEVVRARGPRRLIAAMGVAPPETVRKLARVADEVVCLATPEPFFAVGPFFGDFPQVTDAEVMDALAGERRPVPAPG